MIHLDILIGFSLVMLVFASTVSVTQTILKRMLAVKGRALEGPLMEEIERAWRESPRLMKLGTGTWTALRGTLSSSLKGRGSTLGKALRTVPVKDGPAILALLRGEGAKAMNKAERAEWEALVRRVGARWETLSAKLVHSYEMHTRGWLYVISLAAVLLFNVDAIRILRVLAVSPSVRQKLIDRSGQIEAATKEKPPSEASRPIDETLTSWQKSNLAEIAGTGLPLGWEAAPMWVCKESGNGWTWSRPCPGATDEAATAWLWLARILGLLVAAGLIGQGAPFWYAMLDSVVGSKKRVVEVQRDRIGSVVAQVAQAAAGGGEVEVNVKAGDLPKDV